MTSDKTNPDQGSLWRRPQQVVLGEVWQALGGNDAKGEQISAVVALIRQAETDAFHHGRRSVQRTIVSALDIQHMVKR